MFEYVPLIVMIAGLLVYWFVDPAKYTKAQEVGLNMFIVGLLIVLYQCAAHAWGK